MIDVTNQTEIEEWRKKEERKRLRRNLLGIESYGWDNQEFGGEI